MRETRARVRPLALVAGVVTDQLLTLMVTFGLSVLYMVRLVQAGVPGDQLHARLSAMSEVPGILMGSFCSILGGFVAGWMVKEGKVRNAVWTGVINTLIGLIMLFAGPAGSATLLYVLLCATVVVPLAALGGLLSDILTRDPAR